MLKNNKVIVTGGAGFVGSHLVEKLILRDCDVTVVDNYSSGSVENHIKGAKYISGSCIFKFMCVHQSTIYYQTVQP